MRELFRVQRQDAQPTAPRDRGAIQPEVSCCHGPSVAVSSYNNADRDGVLCGSAETRFRQTAAGRSNLLKIVAVKRKNSTTIGQLYFKTEEHLVLLNNILQRAHLGPLRNRRRLHSEPEAHIVIIPRNEVVAVEVIRRS